MASRSALLATRLARKEMRELLTSRSFALLLGLVSLLVGHAFITAVDTYAELSGAGGGPSALAQGMNPLDGILVPTFGAYDLAATLLLRATIDFTLTQARSSRYGHAARHLRTCGSLAPAIPDFGIFKTHDAYVSRLRGEHGRKTAFWALIS